MKHYKVAGTTINADVKALLAEHAPTGINTVKKHVAGVGYVFYVQDNERKTVAQVSQYPSGWYDGVFYSQCLLITIK